MGDFFPHEALEHDRYAPNFPLLTVMDEPQSGQVRTGAAVFPCAPFSSTGLV